MRVYLDNCCFNRPYDDQAQLRISLESQAKQGIMDSISTAEIMERGMDCLLEKLGAIETERFISVIIRERFDYTKWRRQYFGDTSVQALNAEAASFAKAHPFQPRKPQLPIE